MLAALLACITTQAQSLYVNQTSGNEAELKLSELSKLTFSKGNMVATLADGTENSFAIADIVKLYFDESGAGIKTLDEKNLAEWSPFTHQLTLGCEAGTIVNVYSSDGKRVASAVQTVSQSPIDLSSLPQGIYVVEVAGKTLKIAR